LVKEWEEWLNQESVRWELLIVMLVSEDVKNKLNILLQLDLSKELIISMLVLVENTLRIGNQLQLQILPHKLEEEEQYICLSQLVKNPNLP
jgi:hypothetical protein